MKKIIKSLALTLMTLTCIVFMSACGSNLPPENPEYELTVQSIHELIQSKGYEGTLDDFISTIKGKDGRSIVNIVLISSIEGVNTYRITYSDNTFSTFTIADGKDGSNGRGVVSISCLTISPSVTEYSTYRILYTDGTYFDYNVYNGKNGTDGKDGTSIASITQTNNDKDNSSTIIITDSNGATKEFTLYNGIDGKAGTGIETITKTSTDGLVDTYVITFTDNKEPFTYTVTNGSNGTDGVGIKELEINADGELEITLTDNDTSINLGKIKGKDGGTITKIEKTNSSGLIDTYTISCSDGKDFTFTVTNGKDGDDGRGIKSIAKLASTGMVDTYTITYSDNTTSSFTVTNGVGITYATLDSAGKLILSLSDGKTIDIGNVKGETGNGIVSIEKTKTDGLKDTYIITYTNGDTTTFTVVNGRGIKEIKKESNSLIDTYTITYTDNSTPYVFTVTNGQNGLSAYEIYKIYNPSYTKSESEWIVDLTNGDLSTNRFTVTFNSNGGTEVESQTNIKFGDKATKPTTPTREGYLFDGWYYDEEKWSFVGYSVTENITLVAKWNLVDYNINYVLNGGQNNFLNHSSYNIEDNLISLYAPTKSGYTFYGWYDNSEFIGDPIESIVVEELKTIYLYARWVKEINTAEQFYQLTKDVTYWSSEIQLKNNINILEYDWTSIGNTTTPFTGKFNGNGFVIENLKITQNDDYVGLFGIIDNCSIENVKLTNVNIDYEDSGNTYAGALVAYLGTNNTIANCFSDGNMNVVSTFRSVVVGGVLGSCYGSNNYITNCYSNVSITVSAEGRATGGGLIGQSNSSTVMNCYATGNVSVSSKTYEANAGGLIGSNAYSIVLTGCYASGQVSAYASTDDYCYVGGLIIKQANTTDCFVYSGQYVYLNNTQQTNLSQYYTSESWANIWTYVEENWNSEIWEISAIANPILK